MIMGRLVRVGIVGLLGAAVVLGGVEAREKGEVAPPKATGPQEVEVVGVVLDPRTQQPTVILQGKRDKRHLVMIIGLAEANGIAIPLQGVTPPRPLTHDLFLTLFHRLKVNLTRVVITDLKENVYYAAVYLIVNGSEMMLDSRPSDAIALAIRAKAPILVEDRVFDKSGTGSFPSAPAPSPHF
jgi:bifunctional DNase/RNase